MLALPDRHRLLDAVDRAQGGLEGIAAVRGGDGHEERDIANLQHPDTVMGGDGMHLVVRELGQHLVADRGHLPLGHRRVRLVLQPRDGAALVVVADHALEQHDGPTRVGRDEVAQRVAVQRFLGDEVAGRCRSVGAAGDGLDQRHLVAGADLGGGVEAVLLVDRHSERRQVGLERRVRALEVAMELGDRDAVPADVLVEVAAHQLAELREEPDAHLHVGTPSPRVAPSGGDRRRKYTPGSPQPRPGRAPWGRSP